MKSVFTPISLDDYIEKVETSGSRSKREGIKRDLMIALERYRAGIKCPCGNPIWVIGSAFSVNLCFSCLTGDEPTSDVYEIDEACE